MDWPVQNEDIQVKDRAEVVDRKKHGQGRRLCAVSAIWQSNLPCCWANILKRRRAKEGRLESRESSRVW